MSVGYEVGSSVTVRALHQMPVEGPEGELHPHDYRIDVVVGRAELDEHGMVCDLDALRAALQELVGRIDGKDLEEIRPPDAEAVTVEVLARWAHERLAFLVLLIDRLLTNQYHLSRNRSRPENCLGSTLVEMAVGTGLGDVPQVRKCSLSDADGVSHES